MATVYYKKLKYEDQKEIISFCYDILNEIVKKENIVFNNTVPLKVHFGEKGNKTFITPNNFKGIKKYLSENKLHSFYIDSNVLYKGSRTKTKDHIQTAIEHGFTDLDIVIADENDEYSEIFIDKEFFKSCKIGAKYTQYDNYIVLSHFKGHNLASMGGALKQLAMGFASRGGKLHQHSDSKPVVNQDQCIACGICVQVCPVDAITLQGKAFINPEICIGCSACIVACPVDAISNDWSGSNFLEKLAEYAYAAALNKKNIYFNFAFNITENCDCVGSDLKIIAPDIGILVSTDPVAIDQASIDLFKKVTNKDDFDNALKTIDHADKIGLGSKLYTLIEK